MSTYEFAQGDTSNPLRAQMRDSAGPIALTPGSDHVIISAWHSELGTLLLNGVEMTIGSESFVTYSWGNEINTAFGVYKIKFTITFSSGKIVHVPTRGFDTLIIYRKAAVT